MSLGQLPQYLAVRHDRRIALRFLWVVDARRNAQNHSRAALANLVYHLPNIPPVFLNRLTVVRANI